MNYIRRFVKTFVCYDATSVVQLETKNNDNNYITLDTIKSLHVDMEHLDQITYGNTVPFVPPITTGKVIKVYDGDTFTLASTLPNMIEPIYRFSVRLNGIDTPEIKGKSKTEKELAKKARDALNNLIMNKVITMKNVSTEKYGRILADVYLGDLFVNEWMIKEKYAVSYDGGTKHIPDEWSD